MSKRHQCPLSTSQPLPFHATPANKAQAQTPSVAGAPASTGGTFSHESIAPKSFHTHQFALLIVATALILSKMLNHCRHCSSQVSKTSLFLLGLGEMFPCSKGSNIIRLSPRDVRMWDLGEAEVDIETHRSDTAERVQPVGILPQEQQVIQEFQCRRDGHTSDPPVIWMAATHCHTVCVALLQQGSFPEKESIQEKQPLVWAILGCGPCQLHRYRFLWHALIN